MRTQLIAHAAAAFRTTGADLPGSDPRPTHGAEMEGWFWRITDREHGRVLIALCGVNQHRDGPWATVGLAVHRGRAGTAPSVRSAAVDEAHASATRYEVSAGGALAADESHLRVRLDDAEVDVDLHDLVGWPHLLGAGGIFSALPWLGQYWHPHVLGGQATGQVHVAGETWELDGAEVYAEKNWGAGFPDHWWWGQAQGFDDPAVCLAFGGGRLRAGLVGADVTGCVLRHGHRVVRFAPPAAIVRVERGRRWTLTARRPGWRLEATADLADATVTPAILPVPRPAERVNVHLDVQQLAIPLRLRVWRGRDLVLDDRTDAAGLEVGATDPDVAARAARELDARLGA